MITAIPHKKEVGRFLRFAMVGAIGFIIDFGVFNILSQLLAVNAVLSSVISFICAVTSNFTWNRYWTYPDSRSKKISHQLIQFVIVSAIGLAIRTPLFALLERNLVQFFTQTHLPAGFTPVLVGHNLSLAIVVIIVMFWNFIINRIWTYGDIQ
jgi:putative flippase GtrA